MITDLRRLWKQAFGDTDAFLDHFFSVAYSPARCEAVIRDGVPAAALYWFDCTCQGQKMAYVYAVATDRRFRRQGLCRELMQKTHARLRAQGYAAAVLVPGEEALFGMYEKLGYRVCSYVHSGSCPAGTPVPLEPLTVRQYAERRRELLPPGSVEHDMAALSLLAAQAEFYAGGGCVLAVTPGKDTAYIHELLGDPGAAPAIIAALGAKQGQYRAPGGTVPFAMWYPLSPCPPPRYFGLALD